jgi:hypothetical protein
MSGIGQRLREQDVGSGGAEVRLLVARRVAG